MNTDDDSFGCLGIPTPLEMWKQHAVLIQAESDLMSADLRHARMNLIKLADLHAQIVAERDTLKIQLEKMTWELSKANVELSALKNSINGRLFQEGQAAAERYRQVGNGPGQEILS